MADTPSSQVSPDTTSVSGSSTGTAFTGTASRTIAWLLPVGLMLLFVALRWHDLLRFPIFLDEADHIDWASDVYQAHPFTGAINGKLFGLWWMALFDLSATQATMWLVRAVTVLFQLLSVATLYALGRRFAGLWGGGLAVALMLLAPYSFFYDRMALADPYVLPFALLSVWAALLALDLGRWHYAVLSGLAVCGAMLAKATGIVWVAGPLLVYLLAAPRLRDLTWRRRARYAAATAGVFAALWGGFYLFLSSRGYDYFGTATSVVGTTETTGRLTRWLGNIGAVIQIDVTYFSLPFVVVAAALLLWLMLRRARLSLLLVGLMALPLGGLLLFASKLSARYFYFHVPFIALAMAVAAVTLLRPLFTRRSIGQLTLLGGMVLWAGLFAVPFLRQYQADPRALDLPRLDRLEYVASDASGFALAQVVQFALQTTPPSQSLLLVGMLSNCGALRLVAQPYPRLEVICPVLSTDMVRQRDLNQQVTELASTQLGRPVWLVYEAGPFTSLDGLDLPRTELITLQRPDDLTRLMLYQLGTRPDALWR